MWCGACVEYFVLFYYFLCVHPPPSDPIPPSLLYPSLPLSGIPTPSFYLWYIEMYRIRSMRVWRPMPIRDLISTQPWSGSSLIPFPLLVRSLTPTLRLPFKDSRLLQLLLPMVLLLQQVTMSCRKPSPCLWRSRTPPHPLEPMLQTTACPRSLGSERKKKMKSAVLWSCL